MSARNVGCMFKRFGLVLEYLLRNDSNIELTLSMLKLCSRIGGLTVQNGKRALTACGFEIRGCAAEKRSWKAVTVPGSAAVDFIGTTGTSSLL